MSDTKTPFTFNTEEELIRFVELQIGAGGWDDVPFVAARLERQAQELSLAKVYDITVQDSVKLNIGDYSSAERGVFLKGQCVVPAGATEEKRLLLIRKETKRLQLIASTQVAAIVADTMARDGINNVGWHRMFLDIFKVMRQRCYNAFGLKDPDATAAPTNATTTQNQEKIP